MYSLSTCWNSKRHTDGRAMLREIRELGFTHAELSHGIRLGLLPGIVEAVDGGRNQNLQPAQLLSAAVGGESCLAEPL